MELLTETEINDALRNLPEWKLLHGALRRTFQFSDFSAAMKFVNGVATLAESANHHPDIDIRYANVTLSLATHDAGGITSRDTGLAGKLSSLYVSEF